VIDTDGIPISTASVTWSSLDPTVATTSTVGLAMGAGTGTARIRASYGTLSDTAVITVQGGVTQTNRLVVSPQYQTIPTVGGTFQLSATVYDSKGQVVAGSVSWRTLNSAVASVSLSGLVTGVARGSAAIVASSGSMADTAVIVVAPTTGPTSSMTPSGMLAVLGPLVIRNSAPTPETSKHDTRYLQTESARYNDFLGCLSGCITTAHHYGGLRSRMMWAIRNGEPIGPAATSETFAYGRGRRIVRTYLAYSKQWNFATQPHNNTGLADIEAYYLLEGDPDAYNHIWVTAAIGTSDPYGYTNCTHSNSDARQGTVYIQAMSSAHRLAIPHSRPPANGGISTDMSRGSWLADGKWAVNRVIAGCVKADGSVPSPAHGTNVEAFLFNGWLASTLLQWHGFVEPNTAAFDAARRIMDHLITLYRTVYAPKGWSTLPYTTYGTYAAEDLAGYYVYPSLVLWQETGDSKYKDFAVSQIVSMNRTSSISGLKQWNQMYATQTQSAETLLSGVRWR
jgi:hypothetical protein